MRKYFYVALTSLCIFSITVAHAKHKAKTPAPATDIFFNNDWERVSSFDSLFVQNQNVPKQRGDMKLILTQAEQQRIAALADSIDFWRIPLYLVGNRNAMPNPGKQTLRIRTAKADRTILWAGILMDPETATPVNHIIAVLDSIIQSRPEYKELPVSLMKGGGQFIPAPVTPPTPLSPQ